MVLPFHLKSLQALELAIRTGSFTAAAEQLAITPAAVGQRVKALEDFLGLELLVRGRAGVWPTREMEAAMPRLAEAFRALEDVSLQLDLQRGLELHITALPDLADLWLRPRLASFQQVHPNIRVLINEGGNRHALPADCHMGFGDVLADARTDILFGDFVVPISSKENYRRQANVDTRHRLEGFPLLHLDFYRNDAAGLTWPDWVARNGIARTAPERGIRFQRITDALDAVHADAAIALCGIALVTGQIDSGNIALPYPLSTGIRARQCFHVRFRPDWAKRRHVQRFRDWLAAEASVTTAWLEARVGDQARTQQKAPPV
jgi:LysR family glycine cleavage system transcriptional activator